MRNYNIKENKPMLHNILFAVTSRRDYDMDRLLLLERMPDTDKYSEFVLVEGYHCSCFDFDETNWEATVYTREELSKLLQANFEDYEYTRQKLQQFWNNY